jgi:hypothetical protein
LKETKAAGIVDLGFFMTFSFSNSIWKF